MNYFPLRTAIIVSMRLESSCKITQTNNGFNYRSMINVIILLLYLGFMGPISLHNCLKITSCWVLIDTYFFVKISKSNYNNNMFQTVLTWSESWNPGVSTIVKFGPVPTQCLTAYVVSLVQELPPPLIKHNFEDYSNSREMEGKK